MSSKTKPAVEETNRCGEACTRWRMSKLKANEWELCEKNLNIAGKRLIKNVERG